jgi:divalent metal cation (Fe/Co/Zn/Cd) transporter
MGAVETERLTRRRLRLAQFTVAYNVMEGAVSITAGVLAGLVSLIGFGLDSGIESTASVLVGLRLAARLRHGEADEAKERRALKAVAVTFFVLAAYVLVEGIRSLTGGEVPDRSTVGIVLLTSSVIVMPLLARAKRRVGEQLGGDQLSLTGAAWLDPVAGFVIAAFAIHEGREAWEGELVEDDEFEKV